MPLKTQATTPNLSMSFGKASSWQNTNPPTKTWQKPKNRRSVICRKSSAPSRLPYLNITPSAILPIFTFIVASLKKAQKTNGNSRLKHCQNTSRAAFSTSCSASKPKSAKFKKKPTFKRRRPSADCTMPYRKKAFTKNTNSGSSSRACFSSFLPTTAPFSSATTSFKTF